MMKKNLIILAILCLLLLPNDTLATWSQPVENEHSISWLISDIDSLSELLKAASNNNIEEVEDKAKGENATPLPYKSSSHAANNPDKIHFWIGLKIKHHAGWHSYWRNSGDTGLATTIEWQLPEGFSVSAIHWPIPEKILTDDIMSFIYYDDVTLITPITVSREKLREIITNKTDKDKITISAKADWLVCADICIPETANFSLNIPIDKTAYDSGNEQRESGKNIIADTLNKVPRIAKDNIYYYPSAKDMEIVIFSSDLKVKPNEIDNIDFFPITESLVNNKHIESYLDGDKIVVKLEYLFPNLVKEYDNFKGLVKYESGGKIFAYNITAVPKLNTPFPAPASKLPKENISFTIAIIFAFIGGMILNAMPCVLPVLSIKILSVVKKAEHHRKLVMKHGIAYSLGVILSFAIVSVLIIILRMGGDSVGWGFQMQSPLFISFLILLFLLIGLNLSGILSLPMILGSIGNNLTNSNNLAGSFFTGVLAVLAASPCTVPFMAAAVGFALITATHMETVMIFLSMGMGMAAPYLAVTLVPQISRLIPKPGKWMSVFKEFLAIPIYATVAYLIWVLVMQIGSSGYGAIISYIIKILLFIPATIWIIDRVGERTAKRVKYATIILVMILLIFIPINVISGDSKTEEELHKYEERFSIARLNELREKGRAVFVHATAAWCITCKVNEIAVIDTDEVTEHFKKNNITHLKADWTNRDKEIGNYLASFGRNGVPLYVFYPEGKESEPIILPQILTTTILIENTTPSE